MNSTEFKKTAGAVKVLDTVPEREMYSHDIGDVPSVMTKTLFRTLPDFVIQPESIDEIKKVLAFANENKVPVTTRGAASWGFGGVIPATAGIVIDLSPFRKIISIDTVKKTTTVEAGARWSDIDIQAKQLGLCLMTYPSSKFSTVGGWVSTGGIGINSYKYGRLAKQIVSIKVVTATGEVKQLTPADSEFAYFISTEGVFGIVVEITLKLRDMPAGSFPHLMYFPSDKAAFEFVDKFVNDPNSAKLNLNTIRFLDENHLDETNKVMRGEIFKKSAAILMEFGDLDSDITFGKYITENKIEEAPRYVASYLWNERLFGMKAKRLGPTILASEVIIPTTSAAAVITKTKKIGHQFGVEISIDSYIVDAQKSLIMINFLCDSRKKKYIIDVPLVTILTKAAVSLGAEPYGLGLWNAAFVKNLYSAERLSDLKAFKAKVDPNNILNQGKLFSTKSKGIAKVLFNPGIFGFLMSVMVGTAPVTGKVATVLFGKDKQIDSLDYELTLHACAKCGNCMAVCPAYLITKNEAVTAKGKIALAKKLLDGKTITKEEAGNAFLCMHCKACQEICQTNLELMNLWDALEKRIEGKFGRQDAQIIEFMKKIDESPEYWDMVERNNLPTTHIRNLVKTEKEYAKKVSH
jgi:FAD/FMN-containing dehydrogenase/NAD-dependent dihydropyrimidine dehydrogenase PreA subunit